MRGGGGEEGVLHLLIREGEGGSLQKRKKEKEKRVHTIYYGERRGREGEGGPLQSDGGVSVILGRHIVFFFTKRKGEEKEGKEN